MDANAIQEFDVVVTMEYIVPIQGKSKDRVKSFQRNTQIRTSSVPCVGATIVFAHDRYDGTIGQVKEDFIVQDVVYSGFEDVDCEHVSAATLNRSARIRMKSKIMIDYERKHSVRKFFGRLYRF